MIDNISCIYKTIIYIFNKQSAKNNDLRERALVCDIAQ